MPQTILWFRRYCIVLCVFYALLAGAGGYLLLFPRQAIGPDPFLVRILGGLSLLLGVFYFVATFLGLHMPRRPGAWNYCFALILLGFTSVIFLPFGVFLMMRWQRPEIREYYRENPS